MSVRGLAAVSRPKVKKSVNKALRLQKQRSKENQAMPLFNWKHNRSTNPEEMDGDYQVELEKMEANHRLELEKLANKTSEQLRFWEKQRNSHSGDHETALRQVQKLQALRSDLNQELENNSHANRGRGHATENTSSRYTLEQIQSELDEME